MTLTGLIEKINASYSASTGTVSAIKYYKGSVSKTYGTLLSLFREWKFTDTNRLMGLHGRVDGAKIKALGFITLDTTLEECPINVVSETSGGENGETDSSD